MNKEKDKLIQNETSTDIIVKNVDEALDLAGGFG